MKNTMVITDLRMYLQAEAGFHGYMIALPQ